jgi:peptidoglycan/LPS O-acetylase OafA/YrhL
MTRLAGGQSRAGHRRRSEGGTAVRSTSVGDGLRLGYLPQLDGLRALAVALVVGYHLIRTEELDVLPGAFLGVDVFFVLSGFLITALLLREHADTGRLDLTRFYVRRVRRLGPGLLLVCAVVAAVLAFAPRPFGLEAASPLESLVALLYGMSWWSGLEMSGGPYLLGLTWSLSVEEHFYLAWPVLLLVLLRRGAGVPAVAAVAALANAWPAVLWLRGADPERLYYLPDSRVGQILTGCLLAAVLARGAGRPRGLLGPVPALAAVGWLAWVAVSWTRDSAGYWLGGMQLVGLAAAVLVGHLVLHGDGLAARALSARPLVAIGVWSYGIYLWHLPLIRLARPLLGGTPVVAAGAVLASVAVAAASYRFVEQPVLRGRRARPAPLLVEPYPDEPARPDLVRAA